MRLQRAGKVWETIKKIFLMCKLSKITQAKVFETCVESIMLFNVAVGPFLAREIKSFQRFCDKKCVEYFTKRIHIRTELN